MVPKSGSLFFPPPPKLSPVPRTTPFLLKHLFSCNTFSAATPSFLSLSLNFLSKIPPPQALQEIEQTKAAKDAKAKAKKAQKTDDTKQVPKAVANFAAAANTEVFEAAAAAAKTGAPIKMLADGSAGDPNKGGADMPAAADQKQKLLSLEDELVEPAPDSYTVLLPHIAPFDIDVMKATAQFTARNGGQFLEELTKREAQNPQFDFMRPGHQ